MPLNSSAIYHSSDPEFISFPSRRSVVHSTNGMVACTQPLAALAGQQILRDGGNAADAAVAVAAALNMTEPPSTGIGGDMFCLFYNAKTKKVHALNGSGRSGAKGSLKQLRSDLGLKSNDTSSQIPLTSAHSVTVPGAAAGWVDTVEKFGSGTLSMEQIMAPAIKLGDEGFPISELSSSFWRPYEDEIRDASDNYGEIMKRDENAKKGYRAPKPGEIISNPRLADTFRKLAKHGKAGFYQGEVAKAIIDLVQEKGGHLELSDLENHMKHGSEEIDAISLKFSGQNVHEGQRSNLHGENSKDSTHHGVEIWEHPPNGQGIVALMALGILEELERTGQISTWTPSDHNSTAHLHPVIESLRIAFADGNWWVTDPNVSKVPTADLIARPYLASRAKLFDPKKASAPLSHGFPAHNHSDTVYLAVTDKEGNGISFINSIYIKFGSGLIPKNTGFVLQNRGSNFELDARHPNVWAPGKRPYHTIIPAMITNPSDGSLHTVYGVMGGFMQPQGHVQVLLNMLTFKFNPQAALDAPRMCIGAGTPDMGDVMDRTVYLEEGISEDTVKGLRALGHTVEVVRGDERSLFGRGQVIRCHVEEGSERVVYSAGSDMRGDGAAFPA